MFLRGFEEEKRILFRNLDRMILIAMGILGLLYLTSGIYVIQANEAGILFRFGALKKETVNPGIHYRFPWPIDAVHKIKIREVKRIEMGFFLKSEAGTYDEILPYCLTGDKNIIHCRFAIQYRVVDPARYFLRSAEAEPLLKEIANGAVIEAVAQRGVDPLLTTGKRALELTIQEKLQRAVDGIGLGLSVVSIETKSIHPPRRVIDAFEDVITAREEKSTAIHEAENYRNKMIPDAKAEAGRLLEEAGAYKFQRSSAAAGESKRYLNLFGRYRKAPEVTRNRLFLELVDEVLPRTRIFVLAADKEGKLVRLKLIRGVVPTRPRLD